MLTTGNGATHHHVKSNHVLILNQSEKKTALQVFDVDCQLIKNRPRDGLIFFVAGDYLPTRRNLFRFPVKRKGT